MTFASLLVLLQGFVLPWYADSAMPMRDDLTTDEYYGNAAGDSVKYRWAWKQPSDTLGPVDSVFYQIKATKVFRFFGTADSVMSNVTVRRKFTTTLADSMKFRKPAPGDTVAIQISNFRLCRRGDCSAPSSAAWAFRMTWAPASQIITVSPPIEF